MLSALIVRSSDPTALLVWCGIGFCAGIGLFIYGFKLLQRRRLILDTPFSKIRSAAMGMVEVSGLAVGPYTMIAPITARPCYYYRTLVWEYKQSGKNKQWVKVAGECMHVPFFVDDNTGRMLVDPRGADLDLHCDFEERFCDSFFTVKDSAPDNVRNFLGRHGIVTSNKIKVQEYCIKPKNSLFILGTLSENPGVEVGRQPVRDDDLVSTGAMSFSLGSISMGSLFSLSARGGDDSGTASEVGWSEQHRETTPSQVIQLTPESVAKPAAEMSQQQKIAAALLKAGISRPAAWAAAGVSAGGPDAAVQTIADPAGGNSEQPPTGAFDPHPPVVLMKGTNNKTFLISWRSQQEVARSLGWKCAVMIWGGPALALLSLYFFLGIEHLR
ncbi:MAG TPA: GIDE domain-containing protein [Candidatus Sulfotelmatobacter sp.]|nr:GIDE domain-containing protein [Candidatus Sulfotelmatobacter sp.]